MTVSSKADARIERVDSEDAYEHIWLGIFRRVIVDEAHTLWTGAARTILVIATPLFADFVCKLSSQSIIVYKLLWSLENDL